MTVNMKRMLTSTAATLKYLLLTIRFILTKYGDKSSDVVSKISAMTANQRLISGRDKGNSIVVQQLILQ